MATVKKKPNSPAMSLLYSHTTLPLTLLTRCLGGGGYTPLSNTVTSAGYPTLFFPFLKN